MKRHDLRYLCRICCASSSILAGSPRSGCRSGTGGGTGIEGGAGTAVGGGGGAVGGGTLGGCGAASGGLLATGASCGCRWKARLSSSRTCGH